MERSPAIALHVRTATAFLSAGLATTIAICIVAAAINIATPLRHPVLRTQPVAHQPPTFTYVIPGFGQSRPRLFSPAVSQSWSYGITSWTLRDDQHGPAQEFGQGIVGPLRKHVQAQAPVFYNWRVGTRIDSIWGVTRCGGRATQFHEWRWYGMGWPFIAFRCEAARIQTFKWNDHLPNQPATVVDDWTRVAGGFSVPKQSLWPNARALPALIQVTVVPYEPATAGLAGNVLFFGTLWFALVRGRRSVRDFRAWMRERKTRCRGCGYPRVGLTRPVCPECGTPQAATT